MTKPFGSFPSWWVAGQLKTSFPAGRNTGTSISAIKCLISIAVHADFHSRKCEISYNDLEGITGLSRPMIAKGLRHLIEENIITSKKTSYRGVYTLKSNQKIGWAKVPKHYLPIYLKNIPNRGVVSLHSLKIYLQFLTDRNNDESVISMSYETIRDKVGVQQRNIKKCLSLLVLNELISIARIPLKSGTQMYGKNEYTINGL